MANGKRLIDANALKRKLGAVTLYVQGLRFGKTILGKILESYRCAVFEEINNAPTVDAVEVVRCKDCVWCEKGKDYEPYCNHPTDGMNDVQLDDFCSYGEKRTDDG